MNARNAPVRFGIASAIGAAVVVVLGLGPAAGAPRMQLHQQPLPLCSDLAPDTNPALRAHPACRIGNARIRDYSRASNAAG
jgi:hypothetical protein